MGFGDLHSNGTSASPTSANAMDSPNLQSAIFTQLLSIFFDVPSFSLPLPLRSNSTSPTQQSRPPISHKIEKTKYIFTPFILRSFLIFPFIADKQQSCKHKAKYTACAHHQSVYSAKIAFECQKWKCSAKKTANSQSSKSTKKANRRKYPVQLGNTLTYQFCDTDNDQNNRHGQQNTCGQMLRKPLFARYLP